MSLRHEGWFKMQIGSLLGLSIVNQDAFVSRERVPQIIKDISSMAELKRQADRSPLPPGQLTVSALARWFDENQLARAAPQRLHEVSKFQEAFFFSCRH